MNNKRITYIDTAKFYAILLVVWGHCYVNAFVYAFQVPLFFLIVGFVSANNYMRYHDYLPQIKKLIKRIIVPYILWGLFYQELTPQTILDLCWGSNQTYDTLWFLPTYFSAVILFNILEICINKCTSIKIWYCLRILFFFISFVIASLTQYSSSLEFEVFNKVFHFTGIPIECNNHVYIGFPLSLNIAFMCYCFISVGRLFRMFVDRYVYYVNKKTALLFFLIFSILGYICYRMNLGYMPNCPYKVAALSFAAYANTVWFLFAACLLSISTICVAYITDNTYFQKYGKITLGIYCVHIFFNKAISQICCMQDFVMPAEIRFFIIIFLTIPSVLFLNKHLPLLMGEK